MPHQTAGVQFITARRRVLLADQPGMGKTATALAAADALPGSALATSTAPAKLLIVAPASVLSNWRAEIARWSSRRTRTDTRLVSWEYLTRNHAALKTWGAAAVVFDEAHYAVNDSARTRAALAVQHGAEKIVLAMTGTPYVKSVLDIHALAALVGKAWMSKRDFSRRYQRNGDDDPYMLPDLEREARQRFMLRRTKASLGLPPPNIHVSGVQPSEQYALASEREDCSAQWALMECLEGEGKTMAAFNSATYPITRATHLDRIAAESSVDSAAAWIRTRALTNPAAWVIFASHVQLGEALAERMGDFTILGRDSQPTRAANASAFNADTNSGLCPVLVGSQRLGIGINLQAAHNVALFGCHWTWAAIEQCIDRVHRIGQAHQVNAHLIAARGTVQEAKLRRALERRERGAFDTYQ